MEISLLNRREFYVLGQHANVLTLMFGTFILKISAPPYQRCTHTNAAGEGNRLNPIGSGIPLCKQKRLLFLKTLDLIPAPTLMMTP